MLNPSIQATITPSRRWTLAALLFFSLISAGLVVGDPYLNMLVPEDIPSAIAIYNFPFKATLAAGVLLVLAGIVVASAAHAREYRQVLVAILITSMQMIALSAGGVDLLDLLIPLLFGLLLAQALANPSQTLIFSGVVYAAVALVILDLPYLTSDSPAHFVTSLLKFLRSVSLAFLVVNLVRNEELVRTAVKALLVVGFISACIGIAQVALFALTGVPYVIVPDLEKALKPTPIGFLLRAHGLNSEPHALSAFLLTALPFSLHYLVTSRGFRQIVGHLIVFNVLLLGIFLTWSYGAMLSAMLLIALFPMYIWPRTTLHIIVGMALFATLLYYTDIIDLIIEAMRGEYSVSTGIFQRKGLAKVTIEELSRYPWFGRGLNSMEKVSGNYWHWPPHNAYLQAWAYTGPIGFIIFNVVMFGYTTGSLLLGFQRQGPGEIRLRLFSMALIALMFSMMAEPHFDSPTTWFVLGLTEAAILVYYAENRRTRLNRSARYEEYA
ncbi:MAG: O-antigen ligase family protein [Gammaproteobacteria bacterium]|jgi:hypothetical protein|nr:O-antigen ligase family protein [Gammaproteobacteria bacterium]